MWHRTAIAANELARDALKAKGAAFGWHRLTFAQLAVSIAKPVLTDRGLIPLSRIGVEATVTRLVHRMKTEARLGRFYAGIADTPGFRRALATLIARLRLAQLPAATLASVAPDLVPLIESYDAELAEPGFVDFPSLLTCAADTVNADHSQRFVGLPVILLDIPVRTEAELALPVLRPRRPSCSRPYRAPMSGP